MDLLDLDLGWCERGMGLGVVVWSLCQQVRMFVVLAGGSSWILDSGGVIGFVCLLVCLLRLAPDGCWVVISLGWAPPILAVLSQ